MQDGQNHTAVTLATHHGRHPPHGRRHVGLADGSLRIRGGGPGAGLFHHLAGREVGHHRSRLVGEYELGREGERKVLADRRPTLVHQCQPVYVRVDGHAEIGAFARDAFTQRGQVLRDRLRLSREAAVGLQLDADHLAAQPLQQLRQDDAARAAGAVEDDLKATLRDPLRLHDVQAQDTLDVAVHGPRALLGITQLVLHVRRWFLLAQAGQELGTLLRRQEGALGAGQLERVPFFGVVAGRYHHAAAEAVILDLQQRRRRRHQAQVADPATHRLEGGGGGPHEHRPAGARVPGDGQVIAPAPLPHERAEGRGEAGHDLWVEIDAHAPADTGDADDQALWKRHCWSSPHAIAFVCERPSTATCHSQRRLIALSLTCVKRNAARKPGSGLAQPRAGPNGALAGRQGSGKLDCLLSESSELTA